jgi:hypothetical protein
MSGHTRITDTQAREILARAAEIDRAQSQLTTVDALRAAAREAGIADSAFDEALQEIQRVDQQPAAVAPAPRRQRRLVVMLLALALLFGLFMSRIAPEQPADEAVPAQPAPAAPDASPGPPTPPVPDR